MADKKPWTDRLIESGEKMQEVGNGVSNAGKGTSNLGCAVTQVVYGLIALAILFSCLWSFLFSK